MSRTNRSRWQLFLPNSANSGGHRCRPHRVRRLRLESLESRRLLAAFSVSNLLDGPVDAAGDLPGSLRQAIFDANTSAGDDEITFAVSGEIDLTAGELAITDGLTIIGPGQDLLTIDAQQLSRVISVAAPNGNTTNKNLTIVGLTLTGGRTTGDNTLPSGGMENTFSGAGIRFLSNATLTINDSKITGNSTTGEYASGGGIYSRSGDVVFNQSTLSNNATSGRSTNGGGVATRTGDVWLNQSDVSNNGATGGRPRGDVAGGGVYSSHGSIAIDGGTFSGNTASTSFRAGGAVFAHSGNLTLTGHIHTEGKLNTTSGGNSFGTWGGDILVQDANLSEHREIFRLQTQTGNLTIVNSTISGDVPTGGIAKIGSYFGSMLLDSSTLQANVAAERSSLTLVSSHLVGGGASSRDGEITLTSSTIAGAGVETQSGDVHLVRSSITGSSDGGIRTLLGAVTLSESTISGNTTSRGEEHGGGIYTRSGDVTIYNSTINGNQTYGANTNGGAIATRSGRVEVSNSTISGNHTAGHGGGFYTASGSIEILNSTIVKNTAAYIGGGISMDPLELSTIHSLQISNSIVAGNTDDGTAPDFFRGAQDDGLSGPFAEFSLIGNNLGTTLAESHEPNEAHTLVGGLVGGIIDPQLGTLANYGGLTATHLPLAGSPAINAGDPSMENPPEHDQRGFAFDRVVDGRVDIGAVEFNATSADFDGDGDVDGADFLTWQIGFAANSASQTTEPIEAFHAQGDADVNGAIDSVDLEIWDAEYGLSEPQLPAPVTDAATAWELLASEAPDEREFAAPPVVKELALSTSPLDSGWANPARGTLLPSNEHLDDELADAAVQAWLDEESMERVFG